MSQSSRACPTVTATPASVKAAFTKEGNLFEEKGLIWKDTLICLDDPKIAHRQMFDDWNDILGLSEEENYRAVETRLRCDGEVRQRHHARNSA